MNGEFIAHRRESDQKEQTVCDHLEEVSVICKKLAGKICVPEAGAIIGLLHDFGKYSNAFQTYIQSATGILNPDIDNEYVDCKALRGKIDHSTAGAQWVWDRFRRYGVQGGLAGQILAVCLSSHHGGMLDCLKPDGTNGFLDRIKKEDDKTHLRECLAVADEAVLKKLHDISCRTPFLRGNFCHARRHDLFCQ